MEPKQYIISATEKNAKPAIEMEAKASLYLVDAFEDVYYIFIDLFNDVSGSNESFTLIWDLQCKSTKMTPSKLGESLVTLYKNYCSDFDFQNYILFFNKISDTILINRQLRFFDCNNIKSSYLNKIKDSLSKACEKKIYINNVDINDDKLLSFLNIVKFCMCDKKESHLIKNIFHKYSKIDVPDDVCDDIFTEIKKEQTSKKQSSIVEEKSLSNIEDALKLNRHFEAREITLLIFQRLIGWNATTNNTSIPLSFYPVLNSINGNISQDIPTNCIKECISSLFDIENSRSYWKLFDTIFDIANTNKEFNVNEIYNNINQEIIEDCLFISEISIKYLISLVKDGLSNDN